MMTSSKHTRHSFQRTPLKIMSEVFLSLEGALLNTSKPSLPHRSSLTFGLVIGNCGSRLTCVTPITLSCGVRIKWNRVHSSGALVQLTRNFRLSHNGYGASVLILNFLLQPDALRCPEFRYYGYRFPFFNCFQGYYPGLWRFFCGGLNFVHDSVVQVPRSLRFISLFDGCIYTGHAIGQCALHSQRMAKGFLKRCRLALLAVIYTFFSKFHGVVTVRLSQRSQYCDILRSSCSNCRSGWVFSYLVGPYLYWRFRRTGHRRSCGNEIRVRVSPCPTFGPSIVCGNTALRFQTILRRHHCSPFRGIFPMFIATIAWLVPIF